MNEQELNQNLAAEDSMSTRVCSIIKNPVFVFLTLAISGLYFVVCGIQYWVSAYLQIAMDIKAPEVYWYFSFTCLTAPISGVVVGGIIFSNIGGYNSPKAFGLCVLLGFFAAICALPVPFLHEKMFIYIFVWLLFFFGASILPTMTGIMLNSVPVERRTTANSIATLSYNLLGYLPAPFIYGFFSDIIKGEPATSHRVALGVILYWSIMAVLFTFIAMVQNNKTRGKKNQLRRRLINSPVANPAQKTSTELQQVAPDTGAPNDLGQPSGSGEGNRNVIDYASNESIENNLHADKYYENALNNTEGIFENNLGPSGNFVDSHSPPGQRYIHREGRRSSQLEDFINENA